MVSFDFPTPDQSMYVLHTFGFFLLLPPAQKGRILYCLEMYTLFWMLGIL